MTVRKYNSTQGQLYTIGRTAWQGCNTRIASFAAFKAKYTALFVTGKLNAITAAENLPDDEKRRSEVTLLREQLIEKSEGARDFWQRLKLYIEEAFPENELPARITAAGGAHYEAAGRDNWESVKRLLIDGEQFITDNTAALSAGDNMPAGFPLEFSTFKGEWEVLYNNFVNTLNDIEIETDEKIQANNAVYDDLISMLKDGQRIFKDNDAVRKRFTFDQLLKDITGGSAGLKGTVTDGAAPLPGVLVKIIGTDIEVLTDANGKYEIKPLAAGTYDIEFSKAGYQTQLIQDVDIEAATTKTLDVVMAV